MRQPFPFSFFLFTKVYSREAPLWRFYSWCFPSASREKELASFFFFFWMKKRRALFFFFRRRMVERDLPFLFVRRIRCCSFPSLWIPLPWRRTPISFFPPPPPGRALLHPSSPFFFRRAPFRSFIETHQRLPASPFSSFGGSRDDPFRHLFENDLLRCRRTSSPPSPARPLLCRANNRAAFDRIVICMKEDIFPLHRSLPFRARWRLLFDN